MYKKWWVTSKVVFVTDRPGQPRSHRPRMSNVGHAEKSDLEGPLNTNLRTTYG